MIISSLTILSLIHLRSKKRYIKLFSDYTKQKAAGEQPFLFLITFLPGLEVNDQWTINCQWDEELCANKVDYLCKTQNYPTAFFVASDLMAMAAMNSFYVNNISVPKDVAIIGMPVEISRFSNPPLTTIHVNQKKLPAGSFSLIR